MSYSSIKILKSKLSIQLNNAMDNLIENNVKIVFSGVINDPFIPLYSLLAIQFSHPNITKEIFIIMTTIIIFTI